MGVVVVKKMQACQLRGVRERLHETSCIACAGEVLVEGVERRHVIEAEREQYAGKD
jgi:hypothetical protein